MVTKGEPRRAGRGVGRRWLHSPALALALASALLTAVQALAADGQRLLFAHAMMTQPVYGKTVADYRREIADARAMGIDGFVIELFGFQTHPASASAARMMFEAAESSDPGFRLFLMLSVPGKGSGNWTAFDMVQAVRAFASRPSYFRIDGRPVVATWRGEQMDAEWWSQQVIQPLAAGGLPIVFMPYLPNRPIARILAGYGPLIGASYNFAVTGPDDGIATSRAWSKAFAERGIPFFHAFGPSYWQVCSDKTGEARYFEHHGGEGLEKHWRYVIDELKPSIAIYAVWNDFGESNFMSPADEPPPFFRNTAVPTWTHRGFAELGRHYARWFKAGVEPAIERDGLFFFYRQHRKDLPTFAGDQCAVWKKEVQLHGDVGDDLYVTTMLTAPADLRVVTGSGETRRTMPAGIHHVRVPFGVGTPVFELSRDGAVIARKAGRLAITDTPQTRNFHVYGDYAYAGTTEPEPRLETKSK